MIAADGCSLTQSIASCAASSTVTTGDYGRQVHDALVSIIRAGLHMGPAPLGPMAVVVAVLLVASAAWGLVRFLVGLLLALDD